MKPARLTMITIFHHLDREQADLFSLVLHSAGIGNRVVPSSEGFIIQVPEESAGPARDAVIRYQHENPAIDEKPPAMSGFSASRHLSGAAVALLLLCVHLAVSASTAPQDYLTVFGADAGPISNGELYRCVTALLLHADAAHLAGNMAGIVLFGTAVCGIAGTGLGWLAILGCGALGNLLNAVVHETGHLSVGASTAVFGAVGLLCALQAVYAVRTGQGWRQVFLALGGGLGLLAFLGTSVRSDVGAHLFGFLFGILMGGAYGLWVQRPLGRYAQGLCGTIAVFGVLWSWLRGALS